MVENQWFLLSFVFPTDTKMHGIVKKLGLIEKILAYLDECIRVDGQVKLLLQVLWQALHNMTVVECAFFCS